MNSDTPEERGPQRPQVIDLEAEEIRAEAGKPFAGAQDAPEPAETRPPQPSGGRRGTASWIAAALLLGALAGGWLYRGVLSAYFPPNEVTALKSRLEALETSTAALDRQIAAAREDAAKAAGSAAEAGKQAAAAGEAAQASAERASASAEGIGAISTRLDETARRLGAAEEALAAARNDLDTFGNALPAPAAVAGSGSGGADPAVLAALSQRIAALEKDVASLKAAPAARSAAERPAAALSQALSDLRAKLAAGTPYAAEYEQISRMVPAAAGLDVLGAHAVEGLPDAAGLAAELRSAIPDLPRPAVAAPEEDTGYMGTVMKQLSGIVTIRPIGETDWPAVAEQAAALAGDGSLTQAISVIEAAEGDKPPALGQWRVRAAARLQLEAAEAQLSEAVLRQVSAMGGATP